MNISSRIEEQAIGPPLLTAMKAGKGPMNKTIAMAFIVAVAVMSTVSACGHSRGGSYSYDPTPQPRGNPAVCAEFARQMSDPIMGGLAGANFITNNC
jgi:hypothetical protein